MPEAKEYEVSKHTPVEVHVGDKVCWMSEREKTFRTVTRVGDGGFGQIRVGSDTLLPFNLLPFATTVSIECPHEHAVVNDSLTLPRVQS